MAAHFAASRIIPDPAWPENREVLLSRLHIIPRNIKDPIAMMRYLETDKQLKDRLQANYPDRFTAKGTISVWCKTFGLSFNRARDAIARQPMREGVESFKELIRDLMTYEV